MSTDALRIRDGIVERLRALPGLPVMTLRTQPVPQLQEDELPGLLVVIMGETLSPDGDANAGPPRFEADIMIGISLVEGYDTPERIDGDIDEMITLIETALLTDPTFVRGVDPSKPEDDPERYPLFEAVTRLQRRRLFPQDGETYLGELRVEITFTKRVSFEPVIPDVLEHVVITARPAGAGPGTPGIGLSIDIPTT
ncbi:hypothetical protein [Methylobacterium sp. E-046]|uniref:hypothetical protein n=1 Tax=Methylobacterium sp. E-046 TaxID=2836576 RepID=UPI001FB97018|nr:hypothetical protein [Methylobacterium sp. E-046]MCJ2102452.1 hypothetical protein [Methylobacterium sp. E-046]